MTTKEIKLMIIENFINHYFAYSDSDKERQNMINEAESYVDEDWVDEITQAGYIKNEIK